MGILKIHYSTYFLDLIHPTPRLSTVLDHTIESDGICYYTLPYSTYRYPLLRWWSSLDFFPLKEEDKAFYIDYFQGSPHYSLSCSSRILIYQLADLQQKTKLLFHLVNALVSRAFDSNRPTRFNLQRLMATFSSQLCAQWKDFSHIVSRRMTRGKFPQPQYMTCLQKVRRVTRYYRHTILSAISFQRMLLTLFPRTFCSCRAYLAIHKERITHATFISSLQKVWTKPGFAHLGDDFKYLSNNYRQLLSPLYYRVRCREALHLED